MVEGKLCKAESWLEREERERKEDVREIVCSGKG